MLKKIPISERVSFDLHVNATNALNHANHQVVNNTVGANTSTKAGSPAVGTNSNSNYGSYGLSTLENRQLVIQANITF